MYGEILEKYISQHPSVSKPYQLHVDIFQVFFMHLRNIL